MRPSRLLTRVLIGEVILFAAIGLITSGLAAYTLFSRLTSEFASKGTAIATSIANASDELILTRDASTIQSLVDQFRQIRGVGYVFVVDGDGTIVSHTFVPAVPPELQALPLRHWTERGADQILQQDVRVKGGGDYIDVSAPVLAGVAGSVHVGMDRGVIRGDITSAILTQLLVLVGIFAVAVAVAAVVVGRISRPLSALTAHAHGVAGQSFESGFDADEATLGPLAEGGDEIGELARAFLSMERVVASNVARLRQLADELAHYNETLEGTVAERTAELSDKNATLVQTLDELKQAQEQMVRQEKMASLGALTAGIAHEIKNPLNFVNNFADLSRELAGELREDLARPATTLDPAIADDVPDILDQLQLNLSKIKEHGVRADGIVRSMLLHSRGSAGQRQATDINALVRDAVNLAYHGMRALDNNFQIGIDFELDPAAPQIDAVPQDLMQAFLNIANNACYAAGHRKSRTDGIGRLTVRTRALDNGVEVRLRDNGDGIPDDVRARIFEPFFTTKPAGQGTGLGLSITHDIIVERHAGRLSVETARGQFTEFIIALPLDLARGMTNRSQNAH